MKNTNYRFNIAKNCKSCGESFITDIFEEEDICNDCKIAYDCTEENNHHVSYDEYEDVKYVIDSYVVADCRTKAIRYD